MQQLIDIVKNSSPNRKVYLAKVPYTKTNVSRNAVIQQYNEAIDELVSENVIPVTPPNFYDFYEANQDQLFDNFHPNDIGYQSMATCWSEAIQGILATCL